MNLIKFESLIVVFTILASLFSIGNDFKYNYRLIIYDSYINNDMKRWKSIIDEIQLQKNKSGEMIEELLNFQYGYIAWCIGNKKFVEARKYLNLASKNLMQLEKIDYNPATVKAYRSAFYGFEMGIDWYKVPILGIKSVSNAEESIKLDENNWFGYIQFANSLYYRPKTFGGSKHKAIEFYKKAQLLLERDSSLILKNWNYLNLLTTIALAYTDIKNYRLAKEYYEKILTIEPNFKWVRDELYPEFLKKYWSKK